MPGMPFPSFVAADQARILHAEQLAKSWLEQRRHNKIHSIFPDDGPLARRNYPKQRAFFAAGGNHDPMTECPLDCDGAPHRERLMLAANRSGKTVTCAYEQTCHLTGIYPPWWVGARFIEPTLCWACNDRHKNTRDVNQLELLGQYRDPGTGMIPSDLIARIVPKSQPPESVDSISVKHISGGLSTVLFKSYEQGWEAFTGAAVHVIWCDEEPPQDIYSECLMRTMTVGGLILLSFTPLQGTTPLVKSFLDTLRSDSEKTNGTSQDSSR